MHSKKDIQKVITKHLNKVSKMLIKNPERRTYQSAALLVSQGETKLKNLKLNVDDRRHLSILREAMKELRIALEAGAKGNRPKHDVHIQRAQKLANEYARRIDS